MNLHNLTPTKSQPRLIFVAPGEYCDERYNADGTFCINRADGEIFPEDAAEHHFCLDNFYGGSWFFCECPDCTDDDGIVHYLRQEDFAIQDEEWTCYDCYNERCPV